MKNGNLPFSLIEILLAIVIPETIDMQLCAILHKLSISQLPEIFYTQEEQAAALRQLCDEMETLMPAVVAFDGYVHSEPHVVVEKLLTLFEDQ